MLFMQITVDGELVFAPSDTDLDADEAIEEASQWVKTIARQRFRAVQACFYIEGIVIPVTSNVEVPLLQRDFQRAQMGLIPNVEAHPEPILTDEELKAFANSAWARGYIKAQEVLGEALEGAPAVNLREDLLALYSQIDTRDGLTVRFVRNWVRLIQRQLDKGTDLLAAAIESFTLADPEGRMIGINKNGAVTLVQDCWPEYGQELHKRWMAAGLYVKIT
jgi:hypothetical protein